MSKKKRIDKVIIEQSEVEPFETDVRMTESVPDESEAVRPEEDPQTEEVGAVQSEESKAVLEEEDVTEDLLEDVRRSLIEEESIQEGKKPKWWKRIIGGGRKEKEAREEPPVIEEIDVPVLSAFVNEEKEAEKQEEYADQIDELIDMLEPQKDLVPAEMTSAAETHIEEEKVVVDVEELKKQAFSPRSPEDRQENISEVRAVALEGGEEVFVEVESRVEDPLAERMKAFDNALRPYRRYIYFGAAFLGIVVVAITSLILFDAYKQSLPEEPVKEASSLPYPTSMSLPGGLNFNLGKGALQNGKWNPRGPEWLEGTEVCRWVAIPWSRQLEAVVRTLTRDDQIELTMSNSDRIAYDVYSINQLTIEEMQALDSDSPCLLLVLAQADSDKRWVVTAIP